MTRILVVVVRVDGREFPERLLVGVAL